MSVTALLAQYQSLKSDMNFYTQQQIYWGNLLSATSAQLAHAQAQDAAYHDKYDDIMEHTISENQTGIYYNNNFFRYGNSGDAARYAELITGWNDAIDEATLIELEEMDNLYDMQKSLYEALSSETDAQLTNIKEQIGKEAGDTGLIQ